MVEEGGVEPPFFPNFTMQLSCCPAKTLAIKSRPASVRLLRAPCIPATSKLPGYVARLVVNPDSFYPLKTKLMANIKYFSLKILIFAIKFMFHL